MIVKKILDEMKMRYSNVELGTVELKQLISNDQKVMLQCKLKAWHLELIEDDRKILVDKIKSCIIKRIRDEDESSSKKISQYLSNYLNCNYANLSCIFSQETGITLRDFVIAYKIEQVKKMLLNEGLSLSEIAWKLNYSSVAHLSNQFNKVTGLRPSEFKKTTPRNFIPREKIGLLKAV